MHIDEIVTGVLSLDNRADLNRVIQATKSAVDHIARRASMDFAVGDRVAFAGRGGRRVTGRVTQVNPKTLSVAADPPIGITHYAPTMWRVDPTLCTRLAGERVPA